MPYRTNANLPASVRAHLPQRAQDLFREVYNHAFDEYDRDEARAFRVAWGAVKRRYKKVDGEWVPRLSVR
jgi:cation transport regulator